MNRRIDRRVYEIPDAARVLGISEDALRQRIMAGALRSFRLGRRRLVSGNALRELLSDHEQEKS